MAINMRLCLRRKVSEVFSKDEIQRGDMISFHGRPFTSVIGSTQKEIMIRLDKYTTQCIKKDSFRCVKINGKYYAKSRLDEVVI